jgi:hypothetical protein
MQKQFSTLLNAQPELRPLLSKARMLSVMEQQFMAVAPEFLTAATRVSDFENGSLTLIASSPVIAAKLRQMSPDLVQSMRGRGCAVDTLKIRVEVIFKAAAPTPRTLGPHALDALHTLEEGLEDSPLKQALARLAEQRQDLRKP